MTSIAHTGASAPTDYTPPVPRAASDPKLPIGTNLCRCPSCREYFGGVGAFERHRTGSHEKRERACLGRSAMRDAGLSLNSRGYWVRAFGVIEGGQS